MTTMPVATDPELDLHQPPVPTLAERDARDARAVQTIKTVTGGLLILLAGASFIAGVPGLIAAGEQAGLNGLAFLLAVVIDGALILFGLAALALKAEGRRARLAWSFVVSLVLVSVGAQISHTMTIHNWEITAQSITGSVVASLFPIVLIGSTATFESLRFANLVDRQLHGQRSGGRSAAKAKRLANRSGPVSAAKPIAVPVATPARPLRPVVTAAARPSRTVAQPARAGRWSDEEKQAALAMLATETDRAVSAKTGIGRTTLQNWKNSLAT